MMTINRVQTSVIQLNKVLKKNKDENRKFEVSLTKSRSIHMLIAGILGYHCI